MVEKLLKELLSDLGEIKQMIVGDEDKQPKDKIQKSSGVDGQSPIQCIVQPGGMVNEEVKSKVEQYVNSMIEKITEFEKDAERQQHQAVQGQQSYIQHARIQMFLSPKIRTFSNFSQALDKFCRHLPYPYNILHEIKHLQSKHLLFVVCPISTRIEPDIDHVLNGLNWETRFAVLVVHSCDENALPQLPTSMSLSGKKKYESVEFIDFAFTEESEFYTCEMNTKGRKQLLEFANKAQNHIGGTQTATSSENSANVQSTQKTTPPLVGCCVA